MPEKGKSIGVHVRSLLMILLFLGVVALTIVAYLQQRKSVCENVAVSITYSGSHKPVSEKEIVALIGRSGIKTVGVEKHTVNLAALYDTISKIPFVKTIKPIYFSGTTLNIDLELHGMVAHVYPLDGEDFFICEDGTLLPYSPRVKERMLIANGFILAPPARIKEAGAAGKTLNSIYMLAGVIASDDFYKAQFKQIFVNSEHELELVASVGRHTVLIGDGTNAEEQLSQLRTAYKQGISFMEPDKYCQLDLRFKNRIIAQKR
ncbi:MAG: hypothetical protein IJT51_07300 [Bacteroidales bacterium]|nr:hypothetical protein [Bacteroidales bacterium]